MVLTSFAADKADCEVCMESLLDINPLIFFLHGSSTQIVTPYDATPVSNNNRGNINGGNSWMTPIA